MTGELVGAIGIDVQRVVAVVAVASAVELDEPPASRPAATPPSSPCVHVNPSARANTALKKTRFN